VDNGAASRKAVEQLIECGHREISAVVGPEATVPGRERLNGFLAAMKNAGLTVQSEHLLHGNYQGLVSCRLVKKCRKSRIAMRVLLQRLRQTEDYDYLARHTVLQSKLVVRG